MTPSSHTEFRLLVATGRPPVYGFFASLPVGGGASLVVDLVQVGVEGLEEAADRLDLASVAIVDVALEPAAGMQLCGELLSRRPELPVIALVCCPYCVAPWSLRALIAGGVSGILDLHTTAQEAARALESVARGASVLHLQLPGGDRAALRDILTEDSPRDQTRTGLLELVALGLTDQDIGRRLHLSPHTIKHHIEQLRQEVRARNRTELAAWAGRHGFYSPGADRLAVELPADRGLRRSLRPDPPRLGARTGS